jgi:hypothetical protein
MVLYLQSLSVPGSGVPTITDGMRKHPQRRAVWALAAEFFSVLGILFHTRHFASFANGSVTVHLHIEP